MQWGPHLFIRPPLMKIQTVFVKVVRTRGVDLKMQWQKVMSLSYDILEAINIQGLEWEKFAETLFTWQTQNINECFIHVIREWIPKSVLVDIDMWNGLVLRVAESDNLVLQATKEARTTKSQISFIKIKKTTRDRKSNFSGTV